MVTRTSPIVYADVPRCFGGETVVCLGTGPSLTQCDVDRCRGQRVIAIKDAHRLAPWADVLFSGDEQWWPTHGPSLTFAGSRYALVSDEQQAMRNAPYASLLRWTGFDGLETSPRGLRSGRQSGYAALNLAVLFGAVKIILLGYDMQAGPDGRVHFFGAHHAYSKKPKPWQQPVSLFETLIEPLATLGVSVINASRQTALTVFPRLRLEEALA